MKIAPGSHVGPYEISAPLGAGGMGEVWKARDTRLGREVAIKVLPERVAGHAEALARFEREARAVAALSHPNILAIHDFGVESGTAYAVSEMLEGETLRRRMDGSPIPVRKALDYAVQIARGLAAAHEKGIIHRDLKPENVFITDDGRTKILDFGLAKIEAPAEGELTSSPTADAATHPGTVMGTVGYMSPEQVRARPVDPRSDIFSLGAVLYEMLSGRKAFQRDTVADTMSAILKEEPPSLLSSSQQIPPALQNIVEHCLEKSPAERFQSARDLAFHLEAVATVSSSSAIEAATLTGEPVFSRRRGREAAIFTAGILAGAVLGTLLAVRLWTPAPAPPPTLRYLTYSGSDSEPSVSPDGRLITYASVHGGRSQIWVKQHPGGNEAALTPGPDDRSPRFSPDGSQILFTRIEGGRAALYRMPVVGGEPRRIVDDAFYGDWSPDGTHVAFLRFGRGDTEMRTILMTADITGQDVREVHSLKLMMLAYPRWSPDGRTIAVVNEGAENSPQDIHLVPAEGGTVRILTPPPPQGVLSAPTWIDGGDALLYSKTESFSTNAEEGTSRVIRYDFASDLHEIKMWIPAMISVMDLVADGTVVLGAGYRRQNLVAVELGGASSHGRWITRGNSTDRQPVFSPDGRWVLFSSNRGGNLDLWKLEVETGTIRRITEDAADDWDPAYTPDGKSILWSSNRGGHFEIWISAADGTGARQLTQDGLDAENPTATADGAWVVYNSSNPDHSGLWKINLDGTGATRLVPGSWSTPDVSPDGRHVAFRTSTEPRAVLVARVEDGGIVAGPIDLPGTQFNARPRWMRDSRHFLYTATNDEGAHGIYVQELIPGQDTTSSRLPLLEFALEEWPESFTVSPDGTMLIYSADDAQENLMIAEGLSGVSLARPSAR